jgi:hypothetical protein
MGALELAMMSLTNSGSGCAAARCSTCPGIPEIRRAKHFEQKARMILALSQATFWKFRASF